jgi:hypothetical protein
MKIKVGDYPDTPVDRPTLNWGIGPLTADQEQYLRDRYERTAKEIEGMKDLTVRLWPETFKPDDPE